MSTTTTPVKQSFFSGFKKTVKTDTETLISDIEKAIEYSADKAVDNIKNETAKLDALIESKVSSIAAHNKSIVSIQAKAQAEVTNLQTSIAALQADVEKATTVKNKITTALA